jgi:hypothetical protein
VGPKSPSADLAVDNRGLGHSANARDRSEGRGASLSRLGYFGGSEADGIIAPHRLKWLRNRRIDGIAATRAQINPKMSPISVTQRQGPVQVTTAARESSPFCYAAIPVVCCLEISSRMKRLAMSAILDRSAKACFLSISRSCAGNLVRSPIRRPSDQQSDSSLDNWSFSVLCLRVFIIPGTVNGTASRLVWK